MKKEVWIVDDDASILDALKLILQEEGYAGIMFHSGARLLEALAHTLPQIIFLDLTLGGEDGRDIVYHLKADERTKGVPIIIMSALPDTAAIAEEAGADSSIEKPCSIDDVLQKIEQFAR